ncbi:MAG TPA: PEP-CTERM/exosortase system-associated acyltransferase [Alphaproteobacteria bacterium]|nr:PEP-CTERM/exosortase system-associated acyltransferase [Alphaproteobacteria bacterium]
MGCIASALHDEILTTFAVRIADTDLLRQQAFRLRHQVYCIENALEPRRPDGIETDSFDDRAPHALLFHRAAEEPLGTVRLVLPKPGATGGTLPMHAVCPESLFENARLPLAATAEISRFAVSRVRLQGLQQAIGSDETRHVLSFASLGLVAALRQIARAHGITHTVALMEPSLRRRLSIIGLPMTEMGDPVNHHGIRVPCYTRIDQLEAGLKRLRPDLWPVLTADVANPWNPVGPGPAPAWAA